MPKGDVETLFAEGAWRNRLIEGGELRTYESKEEAVAAGRAAAQEREVEHIVRGTDGEIEERRGYGVDPQGLIG